MIKKNKSSRHVSSVSSALSSSASAGLASPQDVAQAAAQTPTVAPARGKGDNKRARAPSNHRELGRAILAACDPVAVGRALLESESESVRARALEVIAGWAYGAAKPAASPAKDPGVRIIWDLLEPPKEKPSVTDAPEHPEDPPVN
jgi:hypothetical protein